MCRTILQLTIVCSMSLALTSCGDINVTNPPASPPTIIEQKKTVIEKPTVIEKKTEIELPKKTEIIEKK